jgi:ankyrin repeat protein
LKGLQAVAAFNPDGLKEADKLGWTAFHEGTRSGKLEIVKFLLDHGADINLLTDAGISPLWIAHNYLGENHEVSKYLEELGAIASPPRETQAKEQLEEEEEEEEEEEDDEEDDNDDGDDDDDEHDEL